jgi:hypothetical protein
MAEAFNVIGFHVGPGGNLTGIGDWMRRLDAAGIPFFLKSADNYGPLFEAANITRASGVPHTLVFRLTTFGQKDGFQYDVPDYDLPPAESAARHWQHTLAKLPPEFDKELVWVEPINEIDKDRSDWLGHFAAEIAQLALQDGYKVTLFGWSSGEPEPEHWQTEGMRRYLTMCAQQPDRLAVALHEYSYTLDDIRDQFPFKLGRFQALFDACDAMNLARPTVHITEWGWTHEEVPDVTTALADIEDIANLYAQHPQIKGAAIWYLGADFGGIANLAQQLIGPLTDFTLAKRFTVSQVRVEPVPPGDGKPVPGGEGKTDKEEDKPVERPVTGISNARFLADVTIPDDSEVQAGRLFTKTWRVLNNGSRPWGPGYQLVFAGGTAMTDTLSHAVPAVDPGKEVEISIPLVAPETAGSYFGDWRLQDDQGSQFGDMLFLRILVAPSAGPGEGQNNSRYIADITIPDGSTLEANSEFVKTWRVENTGEQTWGPGFSLVHVKGEPMTGQVRQPLPLVRPGERANVSINLTAPAHQGNYRSDWQMEDDDGRRFGQVLFLEINVTEPIPADFTPDVWRPVIWAITSIFESGRPEGNPAAYQNRDAGVVSYGKHQATLASGSLAAVLDAFFRRSSSQASQALKEEFGHRVHQRDASLRDNTRLKELLQAAAAEAAMSEAQDEIFENNFYRPAVDQARKRGIRTPLGVAAIYDTRIQGGLGDVLLATTARVGPSAGEVGEATWLTIFLEEREHWLRRVADKFDARGDRQSAEAIRISIFRVKELLKLLEAGNLGLTGEFMVRGQKVRGIEN